MIRNNIVVYNGEHGIILHRSSDANLVENNVAAFNGEDGIALYESFHTTVIGNVVHNNNKGIRFSMGAAENTVSGNVISDNTFSGLDVYTGNDLPNLAVDTDRRAQENVISDNVIRGNGITFRITDADNNLFQNNELTDESLILLDTARNNEFVGNRFPANLLVIALGTREGGGSGDVFRDQPIVHVQLDRHSSATLGDASGIILDTGSLGPATTVLPEGSRLVLRQADIGEMPVTMQSRSLRVDTRNGSTPVWITPTLWSDSTGGPRIWMTEAYAGMFIARSSLLPSERMAHKDGKREMSGIRADVAHADLARIGANLGIRAAHPQVHVGIDSRFGATAKLPLSALPPTVVPAAKTPPVSTLTPAS